MPGKLEKFADVSRFKNCMSFHYSEFEKGFKTKGSWLEAMFNNKNPIVLELGCGQGEYTVGLAKANPDKNFIGVDIKGNRIWTGAKACLENNIQNAAFLRTRIDFIEHCFAEEEVSEIWITFPDPQPQKPRAKKRLTHPLFLERYKKILQKGGILHLKTDSTSLYLYTLEVIKTLDLPLHWHTPDLYNNCPSHRLELIEINTYYEKLFHGKGEDIKYISFSLK